LYNFETLVPFEVLTLRLDAAIPAPLPMLETLSEILNGNAVKGRQRFAGFSWTFGTTRVVGRQPDAPAAFTPEEIPGTHF
jgi:hypothetical protein